VIIFDTDVCIALLKGHKPVVDRRHETLVPLGTTLVNVGELCYGAGKSDDPTAAHALIDKFLSSLQVVEINLAAAKRFGAIKARLERAGQRLDDADLWIAAITLEAGATLATGNVRHYQRISELTIENWLK
jgi:tRNA(fMet)-specific endonuclease VapC